MYKTYSCTKSIRKCGLNITDSCMLPKATLSLLMLLHRQTSLTVSRLKPPKLASSAFLLTEEHIHCPLNLPLWLGDLHGHQSPLEELSTLSQYPWSMENGHFPSWILTPLHVSISSPSISHLKRSSSISDWAHTNGVNRSYQKFEENDKEFVQKDPFFAFLVILSLTVSFISRCPGNKRVCF